MASRRILLAHSFPLLEVHRLRHAEAQFSRCACKPVCWARNRCWCKKESPETTEVSVRPPRLLFLNCMCPKDLLILFSRLDIVPKNNNPVEAIAPRAIAALRCQTSSSVTARFKGALAALLHAVARLQNRSWPSLTRLILYHVSSGPTLPDS